MTSLSPQSGREVAIVAGGCFWCIEAVFDEVQGVLSAESGYIGGSMANPSYEAVCTGMTGHAEAVRVTFDPTVISYAEVLSIFFAVHDPTTLNRQGHDMGTQYRSAVFTTSAEQKATAEAIIAALTSEKVFGDPIVTEVTEAGEFYKCEAYHDDYYKRNPYAGYCRVVIDPKVAKFRKQFAAKLKA